MAQTTPPAPVTLAEFDAMFESVKNWGRWGADDERGTLNLLTPAKVAEAARLVRSGRQVSMAIPINKVSGPDNPNQAVHLLTQGNDIDVSSGLSFALDYLAIAFHGDCHTHIDALNHIAYRGQTYNGRPASQVITSKGGKHATFLPFYSIQITQTFRVFETYQRQNRNLRHAQSRKSCHFAARVGTDLDHGNLVLFG